MVGISPVLHFKVPGYFHGVLTGIHEQTAGKFCQVCNCSVRGKLSLAGIGLAGSDEIRVFQE